MMKTQLQLAIGLLTLSIAACHILRKDKLSEKQQVHTEALQLESRHKTLAQQSQLLLTDSAQNDLVLTIWPKGKFNYSLINGFEGEAKRIAVHARQRLHKSLQLKQTIKQDSAEFKANYANHKASTHTVQQNKWLARNNWMLVLALLVAVAIVWLVSRYTK